MQVPASQVTDAQGVLEEVRAEAALLCATRTKGWLNAMPASTTAGDGKPPGQPNRRKQQMTHKHPHTVQEKTQ